MRDKFIFIIIMSLIIFGVSFIVLKNTLIKDVAYESPIEVSSKTGDLPETYHFALLVQDKNSEYWRMIERGAAQAAKEKGVVVDNIEPEEVSVDSQLEALDKLIKAKVDAIIVSIPDEEKYTPLINRAVENNIPVITIDSDAYKSKRQAFIGTNNYDLGVTAGKKLSKALDGKGKIGILAKSYKDYNGNINENQIVAGFRNALEKYKSIEIVNVEPTDSTVIGAETKIKNLLNQYSDLNAIFCTGINETIGAANVIIDQNRVGDLVILGFGDTSEIIRLIKLGVLYGTLVKSPYKMGYASIDLAKKIKDGESTVNFIDTEVNIVTKENSGMYK